MAIAPEACPKAFARIFSALFVGATLLSAFAALAFSTDGLAVAICPDGWLHYLIVFLLVGHVKHNPLIK